MKMTSFERLKDLDVTSVAISYVCFKNEILLIIIKEIAALSTISCHAVIPSKWFTIPCEQSGPSIFLDKSGRGRGSSRLI